MENQSKSTSAAPERWDLPKIEKSEGGELGKLGQPVDPARCGLPNWSQRLNARLPKVVSFDEICCCGEELWIENGGQLYRLRRTKQGKLILTK